MMLITPKLVTQRHAADFFNVSERTIQRWRKMQILKAGVHYRKKTPGVPNSPYLYDLDKCEEKLMDQERRDVRRMEVAMG